MTEVSEIALYVLAFVAAAFLPTFVWNVWIAPYRLLKEQVDELHQAFGRSHRAVSPATHFNVADWESVRVFQLGDAACLWVGVEPHSPISDPRASAMFKRLSGEIVEGRLQCSRGWAGLSNLMGGDPWWPKHQQHVSAIALRRYADAVGEAPTFLESVVVPVEEEPVEEEEDRSIPDPDRSNALVSTDEK